MCYCNCNPEPLKTLQYNDNYRVLVKVDTDAQAPDWEMQWPLFELEGWEVNGVNDEGKAHESWELTEAYKRFDTETFERYLRIFHGVTTIYTLSTRYNNYIMFDPQSLATKYKIPEHRRAINVEAEAKVWEAYFEGDVFGIILEKWEPAFPEDDEEDQDRDDEQNWEEVEAVWGFYGWDEIEDEQLRVRAEEMGAE